MADKAKEKTKTDAFEENKPQETEDPDDKHEETEDTEETVEDQDQPEVTVVSEEETTKGPPSLDKIELLKEVAFQVTVELGRKDMVFNDILNLGKGSIIELEKLADEPVDIYVNQSKIAQGEVVVVEDHFGVRISKLLEPNKNR